MNYCGIILAKSESQRLPNKNFLDLGDKLVYQYAYNALDGICDVFVFGDRFSNRPPAASISDEPIFSALKWSYKSLPRRYDAIINIMANCPQHTEEGVRKAIERFEALGCDELRSFSENGKESGLMILKEGYLLKKHEISTYQAAITLESKEIHDLNDFQECQRILSQK